jgi:hypothetical protein
MVVVVVTLNATIVPLFFSVPTMIVGDHSAIAIPMTVVVLSADVVRLNPVRALIRWPRPIAVVPAIVAIVWILEAIDPHIVVLGILVPLDPHIVGAGARRHTVRAGRWGLSHKTAERKLGTGPWHRAKEHDNDGQRLQ